MTFEKKIKTGKDPYLNLHVWSDDNKTFHYRISYEVKNVFNAEAPSYLHLFLNDKCIFTSHKFFVYNKGAREVAAYESSFVCEETGKVYGNVISNVSDSKERWNLKTEEIIINSEK